MLSPDQNRIQNCASLNPLVHLISALKAPATCHLRLNNPKSTLSLLAQLLIVSFLCLANLAHAVTVQATGQAVIVSGDITSARKIAVNAAREQAVLQASAFISTQQHLEQGVIIKDELSIESLANVGAVTILKEEVNANILNVLISVQVQSYDKCSNGKRANNYRKRIAIAAFPMLDPAQSKVGRLRNIESSLASQLTQRLSNNPNIEALNAGYLMLAPNTSTGATAQLPQGTLSTVLQHTEQLDVQFIVSGVVRDISLLTPSVFRQKNYFVDKYNKMDYLSSKYMRAFEVDLFIHDGLTGALIEQKNFRTAGRWGNNDRQQLGFASAPFWQLDYGKQVAKQLKKMAQDITASLRCYDYAVEISRTDERKIWFKAGATSGVKIGDKFDVYRKSTFYDAQQNPASELTQTSLVFTVRKVRANSSQGIVNGFTGQSNIQSGDVLISR